VPLKENGHVICLRDRTCEVKDSEMCSRFNNIISRFWLGLWFHFGSSSQKIAEI